MELDQSQADEASLKRIGFEAAELLGQRDFHALAERFGYALAYGRDAAEAMDADLRSNAVAYKPNPTTHLPSIVVKYFEANDTGLFAVVECEARTMDGALALMDLIVTSSGTRKFVTVEDVHHVV